MRFNPRSAIVAGVVAGLLAISTVPVGATVGFKTSWLEPHTVTFLGGRTAPTPADPTAPVPSHPGQVVAYDGTQYVNSGFITSRSPVWQISFPKAGTYPFICIIHQIGRAHV